MKAESLYIQKLTYDENTGNEIIGLFPSEANPAIVSSYTYDAKRMGGAPTITATIYSSEPLQWKKEEFVEYNGDRFFASYTPNSTKDNSSRTWKSEITFTSRRELLDNTLFFDVVVDDVDTQNKDRYRSNQTKFTFGGTINEFVARVNSSMAYCGLYRPTDKYKGYYVVVDEGYGTDEVKEVSFEDQYLTDVLQLINTTFELDYYWDGNVCHVGKVQHDLTDTPIKYGSSDALISVSKENANYKIVDMITGYGSSDNLPYYYPNDDEFGEAVFNTENFSKSLVSSISLGDVWKWNSDVYNKTLILSKNSKDSYIANVFGTSSYLITNFGGKDYKGKGEESKNVIPTCSMGEEYTEHNSSAVSRLIGSTTIWTMFEFTSSAKEDTVKMDGLSFVAKEDDSALKFGLEFSYEYAYYVGENTNIDTAYKSIQSVRGGGSMSGEGGSSFGNSDSDVSDGWAFGDNIDGLSNYTKSSKKEHTFERNSTSTIVIACKITATNIKKASGTRRMNTVSTSISGSIELTRKPSSVYYFETSDGYTQPYDESGIKINGIGDIPHKDLTFSFDGTYWNATEGGENNAAKITITDRVWLAPSSVLMPSIYRNTKGAERFYYALNNTHKLPSGNGYYEFVNLYKKGNPHQGTVTFDDIKPTINGIVNAEGQLLGEIADVAFDSADSDVKDSDGNYIHSYFYIKLHKFNGDFGFDLFAHVLASESAKINLIKSNGCPACSFVIYNKPSADNSKCYNCVSVDENGNLKQISTDKNDYIFANASDAYEDNLNQDSTQKELWIAVQKDTSTLGIVMPNASAGFKLQKGDLFVITGIKPPKVLVTAAEKRLDDALVKHMSENNTDQFNYSVKFSRIFLQENPDFASKLNENAKLSIQIQGDSDSDGNLISHEVFVSNYSVKVDNDELAEVEIELVNSLEVTKSDTKQIIDAVKGEAVKSLSSMVGGSNTNSFNASITDKMYLSKLNDDTAKGTITWEKVQKLLSGLVVGNFNNENGGSWTPDAEGRSHLITDYLEVRMKAIFEELVIKKTSTIGGKEIISPAGGVVAHKVEEVTVTYNNVSQKAYRCYFLAEQDGDAVDNDFAVNDQVRSESFNVRKGTYHKVGNHFYWRLVIGRDEEPVELEGKKYHYIDLSDTDCATASDVPAKGDVLSQCGNRTDVERQNCLIFSAVDTYSPSVSLYHGINSYSFANREYVEYGVNKQTNKAFFNVYGDMYVGDRPTKENGYEGSSYIKYDSAAKQVSIKGKLSAKSTVDGKELSQYIKDNSAGGLTEEQVNNIINNSQVIADLQNQVDGAIETWFYEGMPTLTNAPACSWTTDKDKDTHLGDLYYDNKTGKAYRFAKDSNAYKWTIITDTDIAKALSDASKAQETADGKMKVFNTQPIPPYQLGDIWVNATYPTDGSIYKNEILRCLTAKAKGSSFVIGDWIKASKYTDDTVANAAKKAAEEAQKAAEKAQGDVSKLGTTVTTNKKAFDNYVKDGYLEPSEIAAMAQDSKRLEDDFAAAQKSYNEVKDAEVLKDTKELTDLTSAFATLTTSKTELVNYLSDISSRYNAADTNGKATIVSAVGTKFTNFQSAYSAFYDKLGLANAYITSKIYGDLKQNITDLAGYKYIKDALGQTTDIDGGLVMTTLLALRDAEGNVQSGINGAIDPNRGKKSIATWWGGRMVDKDYNSGNLTPATSLVRFDGSGYLANGAIWWDVDGKVHADPTSFIISEKNLGAYLTFFEPTWKAGSAGTSVADLVSLKPNAPFTKLGVSGDATFEGAITFHGIKLTYDATNNAIKVDGNLYATGGISAYGASSVAGGGGGLNGSVKAYADAIRLTTENLSEIASAYSVAKLYSEIQNVASAVPSISVSVPTGGNALTGATYDASTGVITFAKGTFLTAHQSLASYYTKAEIDAKGYTTNKGTVTSVGLTLPTGLVCATKTITTSGTFAISLASGYSIPTTTKQTAWDGAVSAKHTHSNKSVLDGISSTKVSHWDSAYGWYALMTTDEETADGIINKWNEVVSFLANIAQTDTLSGIVDGINKSISDEVTRAKKAEGVNASGISTNKTSITTLQGYFTSGSAKKALQLTNARKLWGNSFNGTADINGSIIVPSGKYISIGNIKLEYDAANKALKITNTTTEEVANLYTSGGVSAYGVGTSSSSGGGLNGSVKAYADAIRLTTENLSEIASAYSVAKLYSEIQNVASAVPSISVSVPTGGNALTGATYDASTGVITFAKGTFLTAHQSLDGYVNAIAVSGSGNAVTAVTKSGKTITFTKGATYLTSHQSLAAYMKTADANNTFSKIGHTHGYASSVKLGETSYAASNNVISLPAYPTALKSPTAITIQANGTSLGSYDGSTAKTFNLTYANVGAASAGHNHDSVYSKLHHTHPYLPLTGGTLTGGLTVNSNVTSSGIGTFKVLRVGSVDIKVDDSGNLYIINKDGKTAANFYTTGGISAYGANDGTSSGGGLNGSVKSYADALKLTSESLSEIASAYSIKALDSRIVSLEGGSAMDVSVSGSGNAVTAISKNGTTISVTKGITFLTSHQTLDHIISTDKRSTVLSPTSYIRGIYPVFITNTTDGLLDGGNYHGVLHWRSYGTTASDLSGGYPIQIAYTATGRLWTRIATSSTTWDAWKKIARTEDIPTKVSQLTNDKGYLTSHQSLSGYATQSWVQNTATAHNADMVDNIHIQWSGSLESASWLTAWENDGSKLRAISPSVLSVKYATSAGSVAWGNVSGRPTKVSQFTNDSGYITSSASITGNAGSATKLQNARTINGTSFNGTANIVTSYWGTTRKLWGNSVNGNADVNGSITIANTDGVYVQIGDVRLVYDKANTAIKVVKSDGTTAANFYATGGITAYGEGSGSSGGGGLNGSVKSYADALKLASESLSEIASAYSIKALDSRISSLEGGSATTISVSGSGNAVTSITKNGTTISVVKGSTFLTSHQSLDGYVNNITTSGTGNAITSVTKSGKTVTFTKGATFLTSHQSLSAYLKSADAANTYLKLSGGAMTGNISYKGSKNTYDMIRFVDNNVDIYGNGICIGGGGLTIIGGGESASEVLKQHTNGGDENMFVANDAAIDFFSNMNSGWDSRKAGSFDTSGYWNGVGFKKNNSNDNYVLTGGGGHKAISTLSVSYASSAGSANSVAWSNVSGRPTKVSQFTNDSNYATQSWVTGKGYLTSHQDISGKVNRTGDYLDTDSDRWWLSNSEFGINLHNSDIVGVNSIYTSDVSNGPEESISFKRSNGNYDTLRMADGVIWFGTDYAFNKTINEYQILHTNNIGITGKSNGFIDMSAGGVIKQAYIYAIGSIDGYESYPDGRTTSINDYTKGLNRLFLTHATSSLQSSQRPLGNDGHILHFGWDNNGGWDAQLAITANGDKPYIAVRAQYSGTWRNWYGAALLKCTNYISGNGGLLIERTDKDLDTYIGVINGKYDIRLMIGSGNVNRGIYDVVTGNWMLYRDASTNIYMNGSVLASGGITAYTSSDIRLKQDLRKLNYLGIIKAMGGTFGFAWKKDNTRSIGWIAQHVLYNPHLKDIVETDENGYYKINYWSPKLIATAFGAIEQVGDEVSRLKARVVFLESEVQRLSGKQDSSDKKRLDNKNINLLN